MRERRVITKRYILGWLYVTYAVALVTFSYFFLVLGIWGSLRPAVPDNTLYLALFFIGCTLPIYLWFYPAWKIGVFEKGIKMMREATEEASSSVFEIEPENNGDEKEDDNNVNY